jgi:arylsulfatase A-like enzyme
MSRANCALAHLLVIPVGQGSMAKMRFLAMLVVCGWLASGPVCRTATAQQSRPNIIHILADDLGWGSVGFNNPSTYIQTPHIDALATGGMILNRSYAATVCSPSRAMLYNGFHNGHALNDRNGNIGAGLIAEDVTVGEIMQGAGYATATMGKWGWGATGARTIGPALDPEPTLGNDPLGDLPAHQGYDRFYGFLNHSAAHDQVYSWLWRSDSADGPTYTEANNNGPGGQPEFAQDMYNRQAEQFIRDEAGNPFYLQLNYTVPHFDLDAVADAGPLLDLDGNVVGAAGLGVYAGDPNLDSRQRLYAANITRMDSSIGAIISRLQDPNGDGNFDDSVLNDTLIIFSSDNGATPEDGFGTARTTDPQVSGGLRGGKRDLFEGGIRMPAFAYWNGTIAPGTSTDLLNDLADFQATAAELAGVLPQVGIDGVSILPTLTGQGIQRQRGWLLFENFEGSNLGEPNADWTIIRGDDKLIKFRNGTFGLYDLSTDFGESNPLDLSIAANQALRNELEALALAEGAGRPDNYAAVYVNFVGANGDNLGAAASWDEGPTPQDTWVATLRNDTLANRRNVVDGEVNVLGLEVAGGRATQVVDVGRDAELHGRNEIRINSGGHVTLAEGTLSSVRWVDVIAGGRLSGQGLVEGQVYNQGIVAPGRQASLPAVTDPDVSDLPPLPPATLDTGLLAPAIQFDFTGTQDQSPLTALTPATQANAEYLSIGGFAFGPGLSARHPAPGIDESDAGDEFNVQGWTVNGNLAQAIASDDYLTFTVDPVDGAGILIDSVTYGFWRNGVNTAENFAILSSIDGFDAAAVVAQIALPESNIAQQTLTGTFDNTVLHTGPVEFRVYGWNANQDAGNTHFNEVLLNARIVGAPTFSLDFAGVQDNGPLTAASIDNTQLVVTQGFDFGPGTMARGTGNAGDEFNVSGWSTGNTQAAAVASDDYVSFAVAPIAGMTMVLDSVSFNLWRHDGDSATDYAILTSLDGFASAVGSASINDSGIANQHTLVGMFAADTETDDEVEFRLYGWGAANNDAHTHINAVGLRVQFYANAFSTIDATGILNIAGDYFHLANSTLEIEIGGADNNDPLNPLFDQLVIDGNALIEGNLTLALVDGYVPGLGDTFDILVAAAVTGEFENVQQTPFGGALGFALDYQADRVVAVVAPFLTGDFNLDGQVDSADYTIWRDNVGATTAAFGLADANGDGLVDTADYALWRANFGAVLPAGNVQSGAVPEPGAGLLAAVATIATAISLRLRRRPRAR